MGAKYWRNDIGVNYALDVGDGPPLVEGEDTLETKVRVFGPMLGVSFVL